MTNNVEVLDVITRLDVPAERILNQAEGRLEKVVLVGWDNDGELYFASSIADSGSILWLLEKAKKMLLEMADA